MKTKADKSKPGLLATAGIFLAALAFISPLLAWRMHLFDPWLHDRFPRAYPIAFGVLSLLLAGKIAFRPSERDLSRRFRWLWVLLLVGASVLAFVDPSSVFYRSKS